MTLKMNHKASGERLRGGKQKGFCFQPLQQVFQRTSGYLTLWKSSGGRHSGGSLGFGSLLLGVLVLLLPGSVYGVDQNFYMINFKLATQDTGSPAPLIGHADSYIREIKEEHGSVSGDRRVMPVALSFEFYKAHNVFASGFGIETLQYSKGYDFSDGSSVQLNTSAILFSLSTYYRGGFWFPYLSLGTGTYSAKVREKLFFPDDPTESTTKASFIDSAPNVFFYELGVRFPILETWGMLFAWRAVSAPLKVQTIGERLELGGQSFILGGYASY